MQLMKLYWNPVTDAAYNLALEECMTRSLKGSGILLWRNRNAVIIGRNQNTLAEINTDVLRDLDIQAVRRNTGGGTVYHDLGNLNYSCMADVDEKGGEISFEFFAPKNSLIVSLASAIPREFFPPNSYILDGLP